jgi:chromate reductase
MYNKPFAIMGAGGMAGTARAQLHLRQIGAHMNLHALNKPEVVISYASQKFDADGNLTDANALKFMREQLAALDRWTRQLRGESHPADV